MYATEAQRIAGRWFPKGAMAIQHPEGYAVAYVSPWDVRTGSWQVVAYRGSAGKASVNARFSNREKAEEWVGRFFTGVSQSKQLVSERRAESFKGHNFKVGEMVYNSWGYDQTNVDYYQVVKVSQSFVWLHEIAGEAKETGFMCGQSKPIKDSFVKGKQIERHKATGDYIRFKHGSGSKVKEGSTQYYSYYA